MEDDPSPKLHENEIAFTEHEDVNCVGIPATISVPTTKQATGLLGSVLSQDVIKSVAIIATIVSDECLLIFIKFI